MVNIKIIIIIGLYILSIGNNLLFAKGNIASVDIKRIMENIPSAKSHRQAIEKKFLSQVDSIKKEKVLLSNKEKKLEKNKKSEFIAKKNIKKLELEIISEFKELLEKEKKLLDLINAEVLKKRNKIIKEIQDIVAKIAKKEGYTIVMPKEILLYSDKKIDISDKVIAQAAPIVK